MSITSLSKQQSIIGNQSNHVKIGIIGTANVGKSSLFNVIARHSSKVSPSENALFTTIDPFFAAFFPHDHRIEYISQKMNARAYPVGISVVDTAGIVAGSFREGKGVGTSSWKSIQTADVLLHVLREYQDENITHYEGSIDPLRDLEIVNHELLLYDLDIIEGVLSELETIRLREQGGEQNQWQINVLLKAYQCIAGAPRQLRPESLKKNIVFKKLRLPERCNGVPLRYGSWDFNERVYLSEFKFLTAKKTLYLVNMTSRDYLRGDKSEITSIQSIQQAVELLGDGTHRDPEVFAISLAFEENLMKIEREEGPPALHEYLTANPTHHSIVPLLLEEVHRALGLIHFYTANEREVRCWCLRQGKNIQESAGVIDVQLQRTFMRGEVISFADYERYDGDRLKLMIDGKLKTETKKFIVNDGDIIQYFCHK